MPFLRANYKRIHYIDNPPASNSTPRETFVFIHGLGSSQNYWQAVVPTLTAKNCRCISLDTTGHGRSPYTGVEQSVRSLATDIKDAMDALGVHKAVIVGHSMAGFTVPEVAAVFPEKAVAIVLVGPVLPSEAAVETFEGRIAAVEKDGMDAMADTVPYSAVGSQARPIHHAFIRELLLQTEKDGYVSMCRVIAGAYKTPVAYEKIKCPVLILAGEEDKSAPVSGCEKIQELCSGTQDKKLIKMQKVGHWMCVEAPDVVSKEIIDFFKSIQAQPNL